MRKERVALENCIYWAAMRRDLIKPLVADPNFTGIELFKARDETQQSSFATTRRTYNGRDLSGWNVEADAVERKYILLLTSKGKPNIRELYRGRFRGVIYRVYQADPRIASLRRQAFIRCNCGRSLMILQGATRALTLASPGTCLSTVHPLGLE